MVTAIKIFIAYWLIGLALTLLLTLGSKEIKKGFKRETMAYLCVFIFVSLIYPLMFINSFIKERRKK